MLDRKERVDMTELEHIFSCLSEEAGEIVQEVGKIHRFGLNDNHPKVGMHNERISQ